MKHADLRCAACALACLAALGCERFVLNPHGEDPSADGTRGSSADSNGAVGTPNAAPPGATPGIPGQGAVPQEPPLESPSDDGPPRLPAAVPADAGAAPPDLDASANVRVAPDTDAESADATIPPDAAPTTETGTEDP